MQKKNMFTWEEKAKKLKAFIVEKILAQAILQNLEISDRKHAFRILRLAHDTVSAARSFVPQREMKILKRDPEIAVRVSEGDYRFSFVSLGMACTDNTGGARKNKPKKSKANFCPPRGLLPKLSYK